MVGILHYEIFILTASSISFCNKTHCSAAGNWITGTETTWGRDIEAFSTRCEERTPDLQRQSWND